MKWWRRRTRRDQAEQVEADAARAERRARAVAEQTRQLNRRPPPPLPAEEYVARVSAAFGRRRL